ncbi:MAG: hypothetical protein JNL05_02175 [Flavobacteriales bacterium]|nr:hypothetical protein [Flavobacteriales bacterium]
MDIERARNLALAIEQIEEYEHFGRPAYRMKPRKAGGRPGRTLMTLWTDEGHAVLMLDREQQAELVAHHTGAFAPHPSKWGAQGATIAHLRQMSEALFDRALRLALSHAGR